MSETSTIGRKVLASLRAANPGLSPALGRIGDYVLEGPERVLSQTVTELAEASGSSEASVIRFCREQGFPSFQGFKLALATELASAQPPRAEEAGRHALFRIVDRAVDALRQTEDLLDPAAVETVADRLRAARRVLVFGVGASAITARYAQYKLARVGLQAVAHDDPHMAAMATAALGEGDVALAVSSSGSTLDVVRAATLAKEAGAFLAAITNRTKSPLTALADVVLLASTPETPLTGGALASKISQLVIVDMLFETIADRDPAARDAIRRTAQSVTDRGY
jgi:RpiR family carbohydrate utilization transcriptional regulator